MPVAPSVALSREAPARALRLAGWVLGALGAGLRAWQYLGNPSLWIDELALTRNILDRSLPELLSQPLAYSQAAPPGFLLLQELAVALLGSGEHALRAVPFLAALAALPLFFWLAKQWLGPRAALLAFALFALAPPLVLRAAEVKQYSTDVLIALALTALAQRWLVSPGRGRGLALLGAAVLAPWFSHPAGAVLLGIGAWIMVPALGGEAFRRSRLPAVLLGTVSLALAALHGRSSVIPGSMKMVLQGFMPWDAGDGLRWVLTQLPQPLHHEVFGLSLGAAWLYVMLLPIGWWTLWKYRQRHAAVLLAAPMLVAFAAGVLHLYPFYERLVLYLLPLALLSLAAATELPEFLPLRGARVIAVAATLLVLAPTVTAAIRRRPTILREEARPLLAELIARRQRGEPVYVFFSAWQSVAYYGPRLGLDPAGVHYGRCEPGGRASYLPELGRLARSPGLWIVFAPELPRVRRTVLRFLDSLGTRDFSRSMLQRPARIPAAGSIHHYSFGRDQKPLPDTSFAWGPECGEGIGPLFPIDSAPRWTAGSRRPAR